MSENTGSTGQAVTPGQFPTTPSRRAAGVLLADPTLRSAIMEVLRSLDLTPEVVDASTLDPDYLHHFEILVADEAVARSLRPEIDERQKAWEEIKPALVAVGTADLSDRAEEGDFDGVLALPTSSADIAARLSVVLFSHRALAVRYQNALEELNLNRNIFRSVSNGITVANAELPDMPLLYVNPSFEIMTGYSLDEVKDNNCRFLQGDDRDQPALTLIREALRQQRQTTAVLRNYRKDGSCFWNELTLSPIFSRAGKLTHFVGIQQDVTERVNLESALRESEKLAAVGRLASSISHEINNPLEAVMNLVYLASRSLPETPETAAASDYLHQADEELRRVKLIAAQSLRFYKQSSGPEAVLCSTLVSSVLDLYRPRLLNYGIQVEVRERSTQHIVGLASELRQVLSNLVSNAIDATKANGGRLLVRTREATSWHTGTKGVLLTIADTGTGMSPDTQAKLFKAFYTTKGIGGTGLGLWISHEIIQRHHGHLTVHSSTQPGRSGTVFQLFLPFQGAAGDGTTTDADHVARPESPIASPLA